MSNHDTPSLVQHVLIGYPYCHPSAASKVQPNGHAIPNQVQHKKEKQKEGGGGATMCHNKLEPSKVANEWRSIPLLQSGEAPFNTKSIDA